jgi:hypothetical protein
MAKREAHLTEAVAKLRQISTGLDLYFNTRGAYPQQGVNLASELADFVPNSKVFDNPLMSEPETGHTVSALYVEPTLAELDMPENYVTALVSENGAIVILKTLGKVDRVEGLDFDPWSLISSFNAAGHELVVTSQSSVYYGTRSNKGHGNNADANDEDNRGQGGPNATIASDGFDEDELGGGVRFDDPGSPLGGNKAIQAHVFHVPVDDGSAVSGVYITVETGTGSAGPTGIPRTEEDKPKRLSGLAEVGLGFWAKYQVDGDEVKVSVASDGENTPDPLIALTVYIAGAQALIADGNSSQVGKLNLK